jgi:hypothetical protein
MVRNYASQLCVAAPFRKGIPKFSGRIIGKGKSSKFPKPSETPECGKLAEDQHGEGDPCHIQKDVDERAYPVRNKGLLNLIDDSNGNGDETDEKVTRSRPLSEVGIQSQEKEDGKDPIQRHMKQAKGIQGVDQEDKGTSRPQINAGYVKSRDEKKIGIHFYECIPYPERMVEPSWLFLQFPSMVFPGSQIKNSSHLKF